MKEHLVTPTQNLTDCGCDEQEVQRFLCCKDKKCKLSYLQAKRQSLLDKIGEEYAKIDCLDYMIEKIKRSEEK